MLKPKEPWKKASFLLILALFLVGCASLEDPETSQISDQEVAAVLSGSGSPSVSQSFISRRSGLDSITVSLSALPGEEQKNGSLTIDLYHLPIGTESIFHTTLSTQDLGARAPVKISIPPVLDPSNTGYRMVLTASGKSLQVFGRTEDIYPGGQLFVGNDPVNADLSFHTTYSYNWREFQQDWRNLIHHLSLALPLGMLLLLPGWVLITLSGLRSRFDLASLLGITIGLSLAVIPILLLWTTVMGAGWSAKIVWLAMGFLAGFSILFEIIQWRRRPGRQIRLVNLLSWDDFRSLLTLVIIFIAALAVRLVMVRDMATPAWVDSVHHGLITRLILENGKYPFSLAPYFSFLPAEYHVGFHSLAASLVWLTGLDIGQALLILGQVLNALSVCAIFLLTRTLTSDPRAGILSAILVGFFTPMPAYYTSWGRYTQLTGLLILPAVMSIWRVLFLPTVSRPWRLAWLPGLAAGGLFLVHYRVAAFFALLVLADFICLLPLARSELKAWLRRFIFISFLATLVGITAIFPWLVPALKNAVLPALLHSAAARSDWFSGFSWKYLQAGLGTYTLWLAAFGMVLGFFQRKRVSLTVLLWTALLLLLPNLSALGLPGGSLMNITTIEITLFIPIAILGGYLVSQIFSFLQRLMPAPWKTVFSWTFTGLLMGLTLVGGRSIITILNPLTMLSRTADLQAIQWVKANIPAQKTIAINPFLWGYGLYAGADGGYWITPLTGRATLPPAVLYGFTDQATIQTVNQVSEELISQGKNPEALWETLKKAGIQYVFLGARGGPISPHALAESSNFQLLYENAGTWIFKAKNLDIYPP